MEGKNSRGRRVSLLNDVVPPSSHSHHPLTRTSSSDSSHQNTSPRSPRLSRSGSSDSRYHPSQSPLTPISANSFDIKKPHDEPLRRDPATSHGARKMAFYNPNQHSMLDPYHSPQQSSPTDFNFPQGNPQVFYQQHGTAQQFDQQQKQFDQQQKQFEQQQKQFEQQQQQHQQQQQQQQQKQQLEEQSYSSQTASGSKTTQKKNAYPCPVARQYSCQEHFTTSGHAARHAKKHTGKKDAICPECNKAFTRKDNMEQHRRTHSGGKAASKSTKDGDESRNSRKAKVQQQKKTRPTISTETQPQQQMDTSMLDTSLDSASVGMYSPEEMSPMYDQYQSMNFGLQQQQHFMQQQFMQHQPPTDALDPQLQSFNSANPQLTVGNNSSLPSSLAPALDTLALAATSQQ